MKGEQKKERWSWCNEEIEKAIVERKKINKFKGERTNWKKKGSSTEEEFKLDLVNYFNAKKQAAITLVNLL